MDRQALQDFENFRQCVENAPDGAYEDAKVLGRHIGEVCDNLIRDVRAMGLKADNCDLIYQVEAALYDYVRRSNPENTIFPCAEGFGAAMNGPARDRVLAQTASNVAFFDSLSRAT